MKYLLDTLIFVWWISDSTRLKAQVREIIKNPENAIFLSISSVREMQIKSQLGMLDLPLPVLEIVKRQRQENGIEILPVSLEHITFMTSIPQYHGDPFDFMLVSQSIVENMTLITQNPLINKYPVKVMWAKD